MLNKNEYGNINVSKNALNDIANLACLKVEGVYPVKKDSNVATCVYKDDELKISLNIKVKQGMDVMKISNKVQSKVFEAVAEMTGLDCKSIDVEIEGFITDK